MIPIKTGNKIREYFLENEETIAIAESVTSGLVQWWFSNIQDAEKFFQGGITTYNIGQKYKHLSVEPIHAKNCNCVSIKVAEQMARNVCVLFGSDWGISITGYATAVEESQNKIFAYFAIAYKNIIKSSGRIDGKKILPSKVQETYGKEMIHELMKALA